MSTLLLLIILNYNFDIVVYMKKKDNQIIIYQDNKTGELHDKMWVSLKLSYYSLL